eukprot:1158605-Pelagomonas_calceolata.AAC.14
MVLCLIQKGSCYMRCARLVLKQVTLRIWPGAADETSTCTTTKTTKGRGAAGKAYPCPSLSNHSMRCCRQSCAHARLVH